MFRIRSPKWRFTHIVKSDRINALRKQYDAFLEEDKKRKERNEYILGRLDNMRYSSTAVQIRHKPIVYGDVSPTYNRGPSRSEQLERRDMQIDHPRQQINHQNLQLGVPRNYLGDTSLLKEISKKYILIPKIRCSLVNDYLGTIPPEPLPPITVSSPQANITSNEDWKSKYDILEQLKKKEKEEETNKYGKEEVVPVKESQMLSKNNSKKVITDYESIKDIDGYNSQKRIDGDDLQNYKTNEFTAKYEHEVPEKDLTLDQKKVASEIQNVEKFKISENQDQEPSTDHTREISASPETNTVNDYTLPNQSLEHNALIEESVFPESNIEENTQHNNYPEESFIASEYNTGEQTNFNNDNEYQQNENPHQEEYPVQYEQPVEVEGNFPDSENVYLDKDDYSPIQVLNPSELVEKVHNEEPTDTENTEIIDDEVVQYPVDMLSVQDFTPNADVKLIDGVNVNPNYLASEQNMIDPMIESNIQPETEVKHTEEPQYSSGIEAFDAEQRDMFYSENTAELAYDQQQAGDAYNQEYAPTPVEDYAYYESPAALQEQEYPVEVNEHEESSTRYDQNYEQQYATDYANQEYQGQEQQQYDQPEGQTQQQYQDYEYQQPDQETVQNVEQVLDTEQGYVELNEQNLEASKKE